MKDNIEIQQEFENLVAQLEKLRKINDMTSINEESARSLIETANKMAGILTGLTTLIESDFKSKNELINRLIDNLPNSISSNTIGIVEEFKSTEDQFRADLIKGHKVLLVDLTMQLQTQIENERTDRETIKNIINREVSEYRNQINPLISELNELLIELGKSINKTRELKEIISNYFEVIKTINFPGRFDLINNQCSNIINEINNLQTLTKNSLKEIGTQIITENQFLKKEIRNNRKIEFIGFIVVILILIYLIFKPC